MSRAPAPAAPVRLGLRANASQFSLLVGVNALVGGMIGQERTVVPLLGRDEFGLPGFTATLAFVAVFGATKAATNLVAGILADRFGRRRVLIAGWLLAAPIPLLLIWAPTWGWVLVANALLGVSQGLSWSTTVLMKIDLVGPSRRGFAMGLNEAAGYGAVALSALVTGLIAAEAGLRPAPFLLGLVLVGLGLGASVAFVRETRDHVALEHGAAPAGEQPAWRTVFARATWRDPSLSTASQAGLVTNLNDGMAWGLLPLLFAGAGLPLAQVGVLAAVYPAVWAVGQTVTGGLSDRIGRKGLVVGGMLLQGAAIVAVALAGSFATWLIAMALLGLGTAMVYPTLLAVVADVAAPAWRGTAVGVYRLWRDLGFVAGALLAGAVADRFGVVPAIVVVGLATGASGLVALVRLTETRPRPVAATPTT